MELLSSFESSKNTCIIKFLKTIFFWDTLYICSYSLVYNEANEPSNSASEAQVKITTFKG